MAVIVGDGPATIANTTGVLVVYVAVMPGGSPGGGKASGNGDALAGVCTDIVTVLEVRICTVLKDESCVNRHYQSAEAGNEQRQLFQGSHDAK